MTPATDAGRSPLRIVRVAGLAAVFAGAGHALVMGAKSLVLGQFIWSSRDVVWMAPAGYLLVFGVLAVPLALLAALRPRWVPQAAVVFLYATAAAFSVALLFPRIHPIASLLVAVGIGVRSAQSALDAGSGWPRLARSAGGTVAALLALTALGMRGMRACATTTRPGARYPLRRTGRPTSCTSSSTRSGRGISACTATRVPHRPTWRGWPPRGSPSTTPSPPPRGRSRRTDRS
jgi:hypothetical protein